MTTTEGLKETVLVTGGAGFLGGRVIIDLLERGYAVRTTVRDKAKGPRIEEIVSAEIGRPAGSEFFEADLAADEGWPEAVAGRRSDFDTSRATEILGVTARPVEETFVDCARSLAGRN